MAEQKAGKELAAPAAPRAEVPHELHDAGVVGHSKGWLMDEGPWWVCSFVFHLVLVCSLALISGKVVEKITDEAPSFEQATLDKPIEVPKDLARFEVGETPIDPTELNTDTLSLEKPAEIAQDAKNYDSSATFSEASGGGMAVATATEQPNLGGLGGFDFKGVGAGPAVRGKGGVGVGVGTGRHPGSGGDGVGFGARGTGSRKAMLGSGGGTRQSERTVAAALNWIARHQSLADGSWSLKGYKTRCTDPSCAGDAEAGDRPAAATALGLLPYLAAGQTHESRGPFKKTIYAGISYLVRNQKQDGDLRMGGTMYDHGLAAIALCECYGMSNDKIVGRAAQGALNFIMEAQDPGGGGWRYEPRTPGDTSVVGWQLMALKSGLMANLSVNPLVFERAKGFLKSVAAGTPGQDGFGGTFSYTAGSGVTPCLTAVGLLCRQYMGTPRTDPAMIEGTALLMSSQPDNNARNLYYWYYATQVMHNQPGADWDTWNRKMRHALIETQCKDDVCAAGSWDPLKPSEDPWGKTAGRLYTTSLAALTLEVYYRYLPLYKLDREADALAKPGAGKAAAKPAAKAAEKAVEKPAAKPAEKPAAEKPAAEKKGDAKPTAKGAK